MDYFNFASLMTKADLTLAQKGIASAKVILTGFVVVFIVLILLIVIIKVFGMIVSKTQNGGKKKAKAIKKEANVKQPVVPSLKAESAVESNSNTANDEVVAVISAAVASMYGSTDKVRIKSIKKSNGERSAWAKAGVLDNTRPF